MSWFCHVMAFVAHEGNLSGHPITLSPRTGADHAHHMKREQLVTTPNKAARRALGACAALMVGALTLTACGGNANADDNGDSKGSDKGSVKTSTAKIVISAKDGSTDASINTTGVKVSGGKLTEVKMTVAGSGQAVPGSICRGRRSL